MNEWMDTASSAISKFRIEKWKRNKKWEKNIGLQKSLACFGSGWTMPVEAEGDFAVTLSNSLNYSTRASFTFLLLFFGSSLAFKGFSFFFQFE